VKLTGVINEFIRAEVINKKEEDDGLFCKNGAADTITV